MKGALDEDSSDDDIEGNPASRSNSAKYEYIALAPYKNLYRQSPIVQMAYEYGSNSIPLTAVGMLLNYAGNHLLKFIDAVYGKRVFFPLHKVVSINLMANGEMVTTALRKEVSIVLDPNRKQYIDQPGYKMIVHAETSITFRSRAVILSNGGM